ncbi:MAG: hypothetical protein HQL45_08435 [Alphaproteobacteria bacterium]|nr:hypothetical protein [Alphaproteobacteria bacterium]
MIEKRPLSLARQMVAWIMMAAVSAPLWIWMDGRYGILKALFFALFFAYAYRIKRNSLDVAVFALIMTGLHVFSRQVVSYHQLVFDASFAELLVLGGHAALTLFAAWLMSWLFDLRETPGPTYTRLACFYMIFYLAQYILHALGVMLWQGYPFSLYHVIHYGFVLVLPLILWGSGAKAMTLADRLIPPLQADASWKRRFRDFDNTRAVFFSCLSLFFASVFWFGFVHFVIAKLGVADYYTLGAGCDATPGLSDFMLHALAASIGLDGACLAPNALLSRAADYVEIIVTLFLALVLVQALALALGAHSSDKPPRRRT